jgi:hypothetical protein
MSVANELPCERCGGKAGFQLIAGPYGGHPGGAIYTCDKCGNVIWRRPTGQQQQQPQARERR